jgi:hypothetical protein
MTKILRLAAAVLLCAGAALAAPVSETGEFSATASVNTPNGTRSMAFNLVVSQPITLEQAQPFREVLAKGGQQMLLAVIKDAVRGKIKFGGLEYPANLVVAEPDGDDIRYIVVTGRPFKYEETAYGEASLDYPFTLLVVHVPEWGTGDGTILTKAALYVDEEGHVRAEQYQGDPGTLKDVKRLK